jgi:L-alanine-DL-glutamate epimerase-like enolase superfamily enzyme
VYPSSDPIRIERVETCDVRVPLDRLRRDAVNLTDAWGFAVVRLHTSDGLVGTGYTGVARGLGSDLVLRAISEHYAPVLLGQDAGDIAALWSAMYWCPLHWCGRAGISHMALAAVDIALWDLAAQRAGLPLCDLLAAGGADTFPAYDTNGGWSSFSLDELCENARESVAAGFRGVKLKLGLPDGAEDVRRVAAVRRAIGDDVELMTDVNQAWTLEQSVRVGGELAAHDVKWLEEPLDPDDWRSHATLARQIETPIALGEHVYTARAFEDFIEARAVEFVQCDATRVGGISEFLRVAELAGAAGLRVCPHAGDMMQVHQHLVFAVPTAHRFEHIPWGAELWVDPAIVRAGVLQRPTAPGAGTAIRPDMLERYCVGRPRIRALA